MIKPPPHKYEQGFALIETLIAILIFSIAIIGVTIFQGAALRESAEARNRSEASVIANQIIGDLWMGDNGNPIARAGTYSASGANSTTDWAQRVSNLLPNGQAVVTASSISMGGPASSYQIDVVISWQAPGETTVHSLSYQALINGVSS